MTGWELAELLIVFSVAAVLSSIAVSCIAWVIYEVLDR